MLDNAIQHYWKFVLERLYHIVVASGRMYFGEEGIPYSNYTSRAVVRRLVQEDAADGIRRLPDVWRRILHVGRDYSDH